MQYLEEETQIEQKSGTAAADLNDLSRDTARITDKKKDFKEKAFSFRGSGYKRLSD